MMKQDDIRSKENWLRRIQEGSWEPEILISGIVLYGLFQVPSELDQINHFLENYSYRVFSGTTVNDTITTLLKVSIFWLIIGFISHLLFRSVWAAFVGLSYVYKKSVKLENLNFKEPYLKHLKKGVDYEKQIIRLEKICSSIFALSFLLFMWMLGLGIALIVISLVIYFWMITWPESFFFMNWVDPLLTGTTIFILIDLVTVGGIRRIPYLRKIFYPIHRLVGLLTLSFLYRNIFYGFVSNHKKWKVGLILFLFVSLTITATFTIQKDNIKPLSAMQLTPGSSANNVMHSVHYINLAEGKYSNEIHIPSDIVDKQTLEVFVVHRSAYEEDYIKTLCDYKSKAKEDSVNTDQLKLECLSEFYLLSLNGKLLEPKYLYLNNPITAQDGLKTYLDISDLKKGNHELLLSYKYYNQEKDSVWAVNQALVEFYKSVPRDTINY